MATKKNTTKKAANNKKAAAAKPESVKRDLRNTSAEKAPTKRITVEKAPERKIVASKAEPKAATQNAYAAKTSSPKKVQKVSDEERYLAIQQAAYFISERGNWQVDPAECWAKAEKEIAEKFGS